MKKNSNHIYSLTTGLLLPVLLLLLPAVLSGCSGSYRDDPGLQRVAKALEDPEIPEKSALALLDTLKAIPDGGLSKGERHYKDFLIIKASDKGYLRHTSDSLYLTVKDYFSSHHGNEMLPEVLYYGGRVYSDMGNYPVALQYFEEALDRMGDNPKDPRHREVALSQTGRLLSQLRIYDEALPYVEESLKINRALGDTLPIVYDLELAGRISTRLKDYPQATQYFEEACDLSKGRYPTEYAINRFLLGDIAYQQGDFKTALPILRATMDEVDSMRRNYVLPVAAQAYLKAGIADTAYMYALELISNEDSLNKGTGYHVLLSDAIRGMIPVDTVASYICTYSELLDKGRNSNMDNAAILQHSFYNYSVHDRARQKAEKNNRRLVLWLSSLGFVVTVIIICIFIYLWRMERWKKGIYRAVAEESFPINNVSSVGADPPKEHSDFLALIVNKEERDEAQRLFLDKFHASSLYKELRSHIDEDKSIEGDQKLWISLEDFFNRFSPEFIPKLLYLSKGKVSIQEKQTAMLIKCGVRMKDISSLLSKSKGTIVSRKDTISLKIFGEKKGSKYIDEVIKML